MYALPGSMQVMGSCKETQSSMWNPGSRKNSRVVFKTAEALSKWNLPFNNFYHTFKLCSGSFTDVCGLSSGGATRPLLRDGSVEELHGDPTVGPRPKVWIRGQKWKKCFFLHQRLAASTRWCDPRPSIREVGRNGETTTPRGPTIRSLPIVWFE